MDIGTKEGGNAEDAQKAVSDARLLKDTLVKKGWKAGKDLQYFEPKALSTTKPPGPSALSAY